MIKRIGLIAMLFFLSVSTLEAQNNYDNYCEQSTRVIELMKEHHIAPLVIDDTFSSKVFHTFMDALDPHNLYFSEQDIVDLKRFELSIDGELNSGVCNFIETIIPLYKERLQYVDSLVKAILSEPINYSEKIDIEFGTNNTSSYPKSKTGIKDRWVKWIKYLGLEAMAKSHSINDEGLALSEANLLKYESASREKLSKKYNNSFQVFLGDNTSYEKIVVDLYLKSITSTFDPHSMYLSPKGKDQLVGRLSKEEKSLGIQFEENNLGELRVAGLVPGGPTWKSNQIHTGDIIHAIKWIEGKWMDLSFVSVDVLEHLTSLKSDELSLKVQKKNGNIIEVPLIKELIRADENIIKSFILKSDKSVGYISLPGFYTEFESQNQLGCANDIAKSIIKMQKENIDGLIIDLRNNGGGSLKEAIELSGIFIDFGPITISKVKDEKPITIKDFNRGAIYNKPLLILVNGGSASASELFSASMQDYHRAVIVGSPTFGKATGQSIIPMAKDLTKTNNKTDLGFIKITYSMFYRLNGVSHQEVGISPDVPLPFLTFGGLFRESDYPTALNSDSIVKKIYMPKTTTLPNQALRNKSKKRMASDSIFNKIVSINKMAKNEQSDSLIIPLSLSEYIKYQNNVNSSKLVSSERLKSVLVRVMK